MTRIYPPTIDYIEQSESSIKAEKKLNRVLNRDISDINFITPLCILLGLFIAGFILYSYL